MAVWDMLIVVVYLVAMLVMGIVLGKGNRTNEDYFLAGRSMSWFPVALSVAATMISANSFIGGPGWAYSDGILPFMQNITVPLACFVAVTVTVPVFYHLRISSVYEYMELRLGKWSRRLTVAQFFINSLIQVSSMVFVPALIICQITGWPLAVVVPLIVLCAIAYTITGGIKAVIWTDAIQMVVLWTGLLAIVFTAIHRTGLGFTDTLATAAAAGKFDAFDFSLDISRTNAFLCSCFGVFMWVRYFCFDQAQMQRILTSKSMRGIKRSFVTSSLLMNLMYFIMLAVGGILYVTYGGRTFATSNEIMIDFILNQLPVGLVGLIIAAVFASGMSSIDSLLNSMTTVFAMDIYRHRRKGESGELTVKQSMLLSLVIGALIVVIVLLGFGDTVTSVIDVVGRYISFFAGPSLGAFLLAMLTKRANDKGTALGFVAGFVGGYLLAMTFHTSWLVNPAIGGTITVVVGYLLSLVFKSDRPEEEVVHYTAWGLRKHILEQGAAREDGVPVAPFSLDRYGVGLLVIFVAQYVLLWLIR